MIRKTTASQTLENWKDPRKLFELQEVLGVGSYGSVHKALNTETNEIVAIKIIEAQTDAVTLKKEIEILKDCESEYVVGYRGTYRTDGQIWIVMEYCHAGSIADLIAISSRPLLEAEVGVVCHAVLHGLVYLHGNKLIHRDIKAGNVLINNRGEVKLADFGVSAQLNQTIAKRCTVIGTPYWMSPEVLTQNNYNYRADIWSLGITAIEMATGNPPHHEVHPMRAIFMIPNKPPPKLPEDGDFSEEFREFVSLCLTKNPEDRPSALELLDHPFAANATDSTIIHEVVIKALPEIMEFREKMSEGTKSETPNEGHARRTSEKIKPIAIHGSLSKSGTYNSLRILNDTMIMMGDEDGTMLVLPEDEIVGGEDAPHPIPVVSDTLAKYREECPFQIPGYLNKMECKELLEHFEEVFKEEQQAVSDYYNERLGQIRERISQLEEKSDPAG